MSESARRCSAVKEGHAVTTRANSGLKSNWVQRWVQQLLQSLVKTGPQYHIPRFGESVARRLMFYHSDLQGAVGAFVEVNLQLSLRFCRQVFDLLLHFTEVLASWCLASEIRTSC